MGHNPPMDVHGLDRIFKPQRIALVGVTANPRSVGRKILSNPVSGGFRFHGQRDINPYPCFLRIVRGNKTFFRFPPS